jgi:HAD superfamily hydrolase (TIGR01549 family)
MHYFFDLDHTLIDHNYINNDWIKEVAIKACKEHGLDVSHDDWKKLLSGKFHRYDYFKNLDCDPRVIWTKIDELDSFFIMDEFKTGKSKAFQDLWVLDKLKGKKAVISNRSLISVKKTLQYFDLDKKFDYVLGKTMDRLKILKPHPGMILEAIDYLGVDKKDVVFVGDSDTDILAARNAGVKSFVIKRYKDQEFTETPDKIIKSLEELLK